MEDIFCIVIEITFYGERIRKQTQNHELPETCRASLSWRRRNADIPVGKFRGIPASWTARSGDLATCRLESRRYRRGCTDTAWCIPLSVPLGMEGVWHAF